MKNLYLVLFSEGKNGSLSLWQKMGWVWAMPGRIGWRKYSPWKKTWHKINAKKNFGMCLTPIFSFLGFVIQVVFALQKSRAFGKRNIPLFRICDE